MRPIPPLLALPVAGLTGLTLAALVSASATDVGAGARPRPFKSADLRIEVNATDGDAGLQVFLDDEAWREIAIADPSGQVLFRSRTEGRLRDYGLTELFSESSEPPFSRFPLAKFKRLFPAGGYVFTGQLTNGRNLRSVVPLTHHIPGAPAITTPADDETVRAASLTVRWRPPGSRPGVDVVAYQVLVIHENGSENTLSADLPRTARALPVPVTFLRPGGDYKVEVLAIENSGNQTLSEVSFRVR